MKKRLTKKKFKNRFALLREEAYKLISDEAIIGYQRVFTELKERNINQAINNVVKDKTKRNNIHELWSLRRPVAIKDVDSNIIVQLSKLDVFYRGFFGRKGIIWNPFLGILEDISKPYFKKGKFDIKSTSEDYDPDGKFNLPMTFKKNFGCLITDDMVKELIVSLLNRKSITQDELQKHGILESSIEKYGLEHLVAGGYKKRSAINNMPGEKNV